MIDEQIDLKLSRLRLAGLALMSCALCFGLAWSLYSRSEIGYGKATPSSFREFVLWACVLLLGFASLTMVRHLFRSEAVVSVGPRGIFDRRLSSDWIPWDAIRNILEFKMKHQRWLILQLDPAREPALPLRRKARILAWQTLPPWPRGYYMTGITLNGGYNAMAAAVAHFDVRRHA